MSGGYGGLFTADPLVCDLNTDELSGPDEQELRRLVEDSGLIGLSEPEPPGASPVRDAFEYRLVIAEAGGRPFEYRYDDTTVPAQARPLINHLRTVALDQRNGEA